MKESMNERLLVFIRSRYSTQVEFAEAMGWDRQYLCKILKGVSFGLTPVLAILEKFPELDARWLLLGEGQMLRSWREKCRAEIASARRNLNKAEALLDVGSGVSPSSGEYV